MLAKLSGRGKGGNREIWMNELIGVIAGTSNQGIRHASQTHIPLASATVLNLNADEVDRYYWKRPCRFSCTKQSAAAILSKEWALNGTKWTRDVELPGMTQKPTIQNRTTEAAAGLVFTLLPHPHCPTPCNLMCLLIIQGQLLRSCLPLLS